MRFSLIIVSAVLIVKASSCPVGAYYTIEGSCHQNGKRNSMAGIKKGTKASTAYYMYSNCNEFFGDDPNSSIFSPIRMAFVPVDQLSIEGYFKLNEFRNDGATGSAETTLDANIDLRNTYDEYIRFQQRPRDLLKGLSVPSIDQREHLPQFAKGVSIGNGRSSQLRKIDGHSENHRTKQLQTFQDTGVGGTVKNNALVQMGTSYKEKQIHSNAVKNLAYADDTQPAKNIIQPNMPTQPDSAKVANTGIRIDSKTSKERDGLSAIVWGIAATQEFILTNPQLLIVVLLIAAMLISILRSNSHRR